MLSHAPRLPDRPGRRIGVDAGPTVSSDPHLRALDPTAAPRARVADRSRWLTVHASRGSPLQRVADSPAAGMPRRQRIHSVWTAPRSSASPRARCEPAVEVVLRRHGDCRRPSAMRTEMVAGLTDFVADRRGQMDVPFPPLHGGEPRMLQRAQHVVCCYRWQAVGRGGDSTSAGGSCVRANWLPVRHEFRQRIDAAEDAPETSHDGRLSGLDANAESTDAARRPRPGMAALVRQPIPAKPRRWPEPRRFAFWFSAHAARRNDTTARR